MLFAPTIITGHYGSGKTEFCVNYALHMKERAPEGETVYISDMDVINPYFRSREKAGELMARGVEVIGNNLGNTGNQDIPAINGQTLWAVLTGQNLVVDLAGSVNGLKTLTLFKERLKRYELWVVLNAYREDTDTAAKMAAYIRDTERFGGLKVTGIVHNSHLLGETGDSDIIRAQELVFSASDESRTPVVYTFVNEDIYKRINASIPTPVLTFKKLIMREPWMM